MPSAPPPQPQRRRPVVLYLAVALGALFGIPVLLRMFVVEAFKIPSGSMTPTLLVGDHLFVLKTGWEPRRGDVVVYPFPEDPKKDFIGRVVGLPGETIEVRDGSVIIDGRESPRCTVGEVGFGPDVHVKGTLYVEHLGDKPHLVLVDAKQKDGDSGRWTVPAGQVFIVGDNRNNSYDSRRWNGGRGAGVSIDSVRGRAWHRFLRQNGGSTGPVDEITLPPGTEHLAGELQSCLSKR